MLKAILKKISKNEKGFSLLELIIVISIMGILASQVMPIIKTSDPARLVTHKTNIINLESSISIFEAQKGAMSTYAPSGDTHVYGEIDKDHVLVVEDFLKISQFENPWKGTGATHATYEYVTYVDGDGKVQVVLGDVSGVTDDSTGAFDNTKNYVFYDKAQTKVEDAMQTSAYK
ncbi:MAG: type II secretion system GspH family protein [Clostridia bacterium]|jgi:prepilin-type N-terminal cleavage/methylation domain-containing protein|nr:type II secretion system GspH family protein [Clostridia bacterium]